MSHTLLHPFGRAWLETIVVFFRVWLFDLLALSGVLARTREDRAAAHRALMHVRREIAVALCAVALMRTPRRRPRKPRPGAAPAGWRRARRGPGMRAFVRLLPSARGLVAQARALKQSMKRFADLVEACTRRWAEGPPPRALVMVAAPCERVVALAHVVIDAADSS
jgi:hypothetical protein